MRPAETTARLAAFARRGPGTDAERRAARWLGDELEAGGREVRMETFWCRPSWALAHVWHVALALAGSLLSVHSPRLGAALVLVALLSVIADALTGLSPGRRLTSERASQNVVAVRPGAERRPDSVRLIVTANYDAGKLGLVYRTAIRAGARRLARAVGGRAPGWLGWLAVALAWLLAVAVLRAGGAGGTLVAIAQLVPTVALVLAFALLIELASADYGPAAGDNATGTAVAIALVRALDAAPPRHLDPTLVLEGAGEGGGIGLRRYLRARRHSLTPANTVVLGIAPSGAGAPRWWVSDGAFIALRYSPRLSELCAGIAAEEPHFGAAPHRGRGATAAFAARAARLPGIAIGCTDPRGLAPRSHQPTDTAGEIDPAALDAAVEFSLMLVDALDAHLASRAVATR